MQSHAVLLATLFVAGIALAQPTMTPSASPPGPAPAEAKGNASAPPQVYRSVFADYLRWRDPAPMSWRGANDEAAAIGGPMGQHGSRSGNAVDASRPATPASKASGMPAGAHDGHAMGRVASPAFGAPGGVPQSVPGGVK
jgi:hypothetical protein